MGLTVNQSNRLKAQQKTRLSVRKTASLLACKPVSLRV